MTTEDELLEQVCDFYAKIAQRDPAMALQVATGAFVSLLVSYMEARGFETDKDIHVDGGDNRDITVHAPKNAAQQAEQGAGGMSMRVPQLTWPPSRVSLKKGANIGSRNRDDLTGFLASNLLNKASDLIQQFLIAFNKSLEICRRKQPVGFHQIHQRTPGNSGWSLCRIARETEIKIAVCHKSPKDRADRTLSSRRRTA